MQILIHIPILQSILRRLIRTRNTGIQMLQMLREADAHFERIHAFRRLAGSVSVAAVGVRDIGVYGRGGIAGAVVEAGVGAFGELGIRGGGGGRHFCMGVGALLLWDAWCGGADGIYFAGLTTNLFDVFCSVIATSTSSRRKIKVGKKSSRWSQTQIQK